MREVCHFGVALRNVYGRLICERWDSGSISPTAPARPRYGGEPLSRVSAGSEKEGAPAPLNGILRMWNRAAHAERLSNPAEAELSSLSAVSDAMS